MEYTHLVDLFAALSLSSVNSGKKSNIPSTIPSTSKYVKFLKNQSPLRRALRCDTSTPRPPSRALYTSLKARHQAPPIRDPTNCDLDTFTAPSYRPSLRPTAPLCNPSISVPKTSSKEKLTACLSRAIEPNKTGVAASLR